ncbi:MAG: CDP-alcohol phosphatidyltransferase family protein, partial [Planctomycetaceae bacterium]|nr:CDP-alcohol phosphatidyltransferase family protein [Planctomycetaceae bacterium]
RHTPITPNQVSWLTIVFGVSACLTLAGVIPYGAPFAAACIFAQMVLDCADGQLARARGGGSRAGRILDGVADYINAVALHVGLYLYLVQRGGTVLGFEAERWTVAGLVIAAGVGMALNAVAYDGLKGRFKRITGAAKDETDKPEDIARELAAATSIEERVLLWLYWQYCRVQSSARRPSQRMAPVSEEAAALNREKYHWNMWLWSLIGPTMHFTGIAAAALLTVWNPESIEWYLFAAIVPANIFMLVMLAWTRALDRDSPSMGSAQ